MSESWTEICQTTKKSTQQQWFGTWNPDSVLCSSSVLKPIVCVWLPKSFITVSIAKPQRRVREFKGKNIGRKKVQQNGWLLFLSKKIWLRLLCINIQYSLPCHGTTYSHSMNKGKLVQSNTKVSYNKLQYSLEIVT
jgi:hypothetical protein